MVAARGGCNRHAEEGQLGSLVWSAVQSSHTSAMRSNFCGELIHRDLFLPFAADDLFAVLFEPIPPTALHELCTQHLLKPAREDAAWCAVSDLKQTCAAHGTSCAFALCTRPPVALAGVHQDFLNRPGHPVSFVHDGRHSFRFAGWCPLPTLHPATRHRHDFGSS